MTLVTDRQRHIPSRSATRTASIAKPATVGRSSTAVRENPTQKRTLVRDGFTRSAESADDGKSSRVDSILQGLGESLSGGVDGAVGGGPKKGGFPKPKGPFDDFNKKREEQQEQLEERLTPEGYDIWKTADSVVEEKAQLDEKRTQWGPEQKTQEHTVDTLSESLADSAAENPEAFAKALVEAEQAADEWREYNALNDKYREDKQRYDEYQKNETGGGNGIGIFGPPPEPTPPKVPNTPGGWRAEERHAVLNEAMVDAIANDPEAAKEIADALKAEREQAAE